MLTIPIAIYLALCVAVAIWGRKAVMGPIGVFLLSVILTPFVAFVGLLLFAPRRGGRPTSEPELRDRP